MVRIRLLAVVCCSLASLAVSAAPARAAVCGNGILEAGEACDDGNTTPLDGCSDLCALESVVPFLGSAQGGMLTYTIASETLSIPTSPGDTPAQVASALAAAINGNATLAGLGIAADDVGDTLIHGGSPSGFGGTDAGIAIRTNDPSLLAALSAIPRVLDFEALMAGDPVPDATTLEGITFDYALGGATALVTDLFDTASPTNSLGLGGGDDAFLDGDALGFDLPRPVLALGISVVTSDPAAASEILLSTSHGTSGNSAMPESTGADGGRRYFLAHIAALPFSQASLDFASDEGIHFVYTVDDLDAAVPTDGTFPLSGTAQGGHAVGVVVDGVSVEITTTPGQTAGEVVQALADAINANATLQALGTAAVADGDQLLTNGTITGQTNQDPGLGGIPEPQVPALGPAALGLLAALLAGAAALVTRRRARA